MYTMYSSMVDTFARKKDPVSRLLGLCMYDMMCIYIYVYIHTYIYIYIDIDACRYVDPLAVLTNILVPGLEDRVGISYTYTYTPQQFLKMILVLV